jgi:hypothetical protein
MNLARIDTPVISIYKTKAAAEAAIAAITIEDDDVTYAAIETENGFVIDGPRRLTP